MPAVRTSSQHAGDAAQLQLIHSITTGAASVTFWLFAQLPQVIENYRNGS